MATGVMWIVTGYTLHATVRERDAAVGGRQTAGRVVSRIGDRIGDADRMSRQSADAELRRPELPRQAGRVRRRIHVGCDDTIMAAETEERRTVQIDANGFVRSQSVGRRRSLVEQWCFGVFDVWRMTGRAKITGMSAGLGKIVSATDDSGGQSGFDGIDVAELVWPSRIVEIPRRVDRFLVVAAG